MGGGDIKLMGMIGAFLGPKGVAFVIFIGSLLGALIGSLLILIKGGDRRTAIPFGPFLSLGAALCILFGQEIISWYTRFLWGR